MTMDELAKQLSGWGGIGIDRPVVNETGLTSPYDFQLDVGWPGAPKAVKVWHSQAALILGPPSTWPSNKSASSSNLARYRCP
jgi:uncharacterized protein (TIGR03435 family)